MSHCFHLFSQFPSVTSKCRQRNNSCRNVRTTALELAWGPHIFTVISRFVHLNVSVEKDVRHVFLRTQP